MIFIAVEELPSKRIFMAVVELPSKRLFIAAIVLVKGMSKEIILPGSGSWDTGNSAPVKIIIR